jgi:DNA-binding HxlR family transcriptional regulator
MKKIDILNFITNFRKAPNDVKTYNELLNHLGHVHAAVIDEMLRDLQTTRVIRETELNGQKAYQVISR